MTDFCVFLCKGLSGWAVSKGLSTVLSGLGLPHRRQPDVISNALVHERVDIVGSTGVKGHHVDRCLFDVASKAASDSLRHREVVLNMATSRVTHDYPTVPVSIAPEFLLSDHESLGHTFVANHGGLIHCSEMLLGSTVASL
jgi:hypothetical protein